MRVLGRQSRRRSKTDVGGGLDIMGNIKDKNWEKAKFDTKADPFVLQLKVKMKGFFDPNVTSKITPLHYACANNPPKSFLDFYYDMYPKAFLSHDSTYKRVALHIACMQQSPSLMVISKLLELNVLAAHEEDRFGRLPMHYACNHNASPSVIHLLVGAYPASLFIADMNGWLPIHVACRSVIAAHKKERQTTAATSNSCTDDNNNPAATFATPPTTTMTTLLEVVDIMLKVNPSVTHKKTNKGVTPLTMAKQSDCSTLYDLLQKVSLCDESETSVVNLSGLSSELPSVKTK